MIFANVLAWFYGSEFSLPKLLADFPNGFSLCCVLGKAHNQTISKLLARLVAVNVGHYHGRRACVIKLLHELSCLRLCRIARGLEPAQRTDSLVAVLLQPSPPLAAVLLFQERADEDVKDMPFRRVVLRRQLRWFTAKLRQHFVLRCCLTIRVCADDFPIQIEAFRKQCAVSKPNAISSAELAAHGRDFQLKLPVVVPGPLDARPVHHPVFAKQSPSLIELAADAVRQAVLVRLLRREHSVLVPGTNDPVPVTIPHRYSFTKLSASIKVLLLDGGAHYVCIHYRLFPPSGSIQHSVGRKANKELFTAFGNGRGANSTQPHERHREAPLREPRQAAPDWARASAVLSSIENSRFSRGTEPLRRKCYFVFVTSCLAASSIAKRTISEIRGRLQPRSDRRSILAGSGRLLSLPKILHTKLLGFAVGHSPQNCPPSAATDSSDENLEAKTSGGGGRVKEERKPLNRSILDAPADATQSNPVSSRCHGGLSNDSPKSVL